MVETTQQTRCHDTVTLERVEFEAFWCIIGEALKIIEAQANGEDAK